MGGNATPLKTPTRGIITSTHNLGGLSPLTFLGDYDPLERTITFHYPGGLSPPTDDYPLSQSWGIITP